MSARIGYAGGGAFDLFHIGHVNPPRPARANGDVLIAGVVIDEMLVQTKAVPLAERLALVALPKWFRNIDRTSR